MSSIGMDSVELSRQGGFSVRIAEPDDLPLINAIYNYEVENGIATWDYEPWDLAKRIEWFREHDPANDPASPVFVAVDQEASVLGFAYLSQYRRKDGYRFTREDTVYVDPAHRRRGVGKALLARLIESARENGLHTLLAWIVSDNHGSSELHRQFGFVPIGTEKETGFKFERWIDDVEWQLML